MKRTLSYLAVFSAGLFLAWPAAAQNTSRFNFHIGGGFTEPVRYSDGRLDTGFNLTGGAGLNLTPHLGVMGELGFNHLGVSSTILNAVGTPGGAARIYSLTLNPIVRFNPRGRYHFYLVGGGGYYRRTVDFTAPTTTTVTAFDPFLGLFYPAAVPSTAILSSYTQNKGGWNIGGGVSVRVKGDSNTRFFAESRYHYMYTAPYRTTYLPVTFGLRW
jgi:hypothetical protein